MLVCFGNFSTVSFDIKLISCLISKVLKKCYKYHVNVLNSNIIAIAKNKKINYSFKTIGLPENLFFRHNNLFFDWLDCRMNFAL